MIIMILFNSSYNIINSNCDCDCEVTAEGAYLYIIAACVFFWRASVRTEEEKWVTMLCRRYMYCCMICFFRIKP